MRRDWIVRGSWPTSQLARLSGPQIIGPASSCSKCRRPQLSAPFHGVGEKCVSGLRAKKAVSGVDINRATNDDWAGPVNRTAVRWDAIDRAILDFRVHIPDDTTVFGRVGAKMTIEPAREHDAGDCGNSGRLCGAAARNVVTARMRRLSDLIARLKIQSMQTAAHSVVQEKRDL